MRRIALTLICALAISAAHAASDSDLDPSFARSGPGYGYYFFDQFGDKRDYALAIAKQPSGNYVVAGEIAANTSIGMKVGVVHIARSNGAETLRYDYDGGLLNVRGVAVDGSASTVVVGLANTSLDGAPDLGVLRFRTNGTPDPSFAGDGGTIIDSGHTASATDNPIAVVARADRSIVVLVEEEAPANAGINPFVLVSIATNGLTHGVLPLGASGANGGALLLQPDGKIVVLVNEIVAGCSRVKLYRFAPNTLVNLDSTFAGDGIAVVPNPTGIGCGAPAMRALALDHAGRIVLGGTAASLSAAAGWVARVRADGVVDTSFSSDGWAQVPRPIGGDVHFVEAVGVQSDGAILAGGFFTYSNASVGTRAIMSRILPGGVADTSYNPSISARIYTTGTNASDETGIAMVMDGDRGVLAGARLANAPLDYDFQVIRTLGPTLRDGFE